MEEMTKLTKKAVSLLHCPMRWMILCHFILTTPMTMNKVVVPGGMAMKTYRVVVHRTMMHKGQTQVHRHIIIKPMDHKTIRMVAHPQMMVGGKW